jgi:hypothetical protein
MFGRTKLAGILGVAVLAAACSESTGPYHRSPYIPLFQDVAVGSGIALDQFNGTLGLSGRLLIKGFNPTNPHRGDAIVATFYWTGSTNIIDSVTDVITNPEFTAVGNTYTLVEYVTSGGYSMATYVATNVQNFPDPNTDQGQVLAVRAHLSEPVADGGVTITAWSGVNSVASYAVGDHLSGSGVSSGIVSVGPGAVRTGAGALALAVTMSDGLYGRDPPLGFTRIGTGSDGVMLNESDYAVQSAVGSVDPQWTWFFGSASTWLATVIALNPPLHLAFTVQPSTTLPLMTINPAVHVTVLDAFDNPVTDFNGQVTIAIGQNGGLLLPGTLLGTKTVTVVNGVATFSDLSIDQVGNGYTLVAIVPNVVRSESTPFNIGAF